MAENIDEIMRKIAHTFEGDPANKYTYYQQFAPLFHSNELVVDFGCGDGTFLDILQQKGIKSLGVELDPVQAKAAKAKGIEVFTDDIRNISQVLEQPMDALIMAHIIEHFDPMDIIPVLWQVLQKNRPHKMLIITPNIGHQQVLENFWLDISHKRPYPLQLLQAIMHHLGFPNIQMGHAVQGLDCWVWAYTKPVDRIDSL